MTGKCLKKHYGACRFRDQNDDCLWTLDGCHFHSAESPQAASEADVPLNDVLCDELRHDIFVLVLRLMGEDEATHAPETIAVLEKWKPAVCAKLEDISRTI